MKRYNILQIGYPTVEDWKNSNRSSITVKERGYADVEDDNGPEDVWHLCNWSCYSDTKSDNLHSDITHCNADIIVWVEGGKEGYWVAEECGWEKFTSLEKAKEYMLSTRETRFYPFR